MKICFHSHFYANFLCKFAYKFYVGQLKQQICYSFILLILIDLNLRSSSFRRYQFFPISMVQMLFPQIQHAPGPDFRTVGKSLKGADKTGLMCRLVCAFVVGMQQDQAPRL